MTTITLTLTNVCTGGNHLRFSITGAATLTVDSTLDEMLDPLTEQDMRGYINCIMRMAKNGRTNGQAKTLLQSGVVVTV